MGESMYGKFVCMEESIDEKNFQEQKLRFTHFRA
jgi:hypothetical protein